MRPRIGNFTRAVIALGVAAGILLGLRPMLPKQMRHEVDDFFTRPFVPHYIVPVHGLKAVRKKQVVDELNARRFDVRCYGNPAPSEKIIAKDGFYRETTLKAAFDRIPIPVEMVSIERPFSALDAPPRSNTAVTDDHESAPENVRENR